MKKQVLIMVTIVVLLIGGVAFLAISSGNNKDTNVTSSSGVKNEDEQSSGNENQQPGNATEIKIEDFAYSPKTITIKKGTTLTWTNQDSVAHTVTGEDGGPDSELLDQGETYSYTFNEAGSFAYFCKPHPEMQATVIVTD